jgi:CBS domain-containing protein
MTRVLVTAPPHLNVEAAMALMTERRTRHVLVTEGETLLGIVSIGDLVKATIEEQQFVIAQLEQYVRS